MMTEQRGMKSKISEIINGQYTVKIDLNTCLDPPQIGELESNLKDIFKRDDSFTINSLGSLCSFNNRILTYKSETILPLIHKRNKEKILMELKRILSYRFTKNATLIFVQKDTYETFASLNISNIKRCIYWPAVSRRKDAPKKGSDLAERLTEP